MVAMDYADAGTEDKDEGAVKLLVGRERHTGHTFCHLVTCKGTGDERIVGKVMQSIAETGCTDVVLKTDGEPALIQVQEAVVGKRGHRAIPDNPPACETIPPTTIMHANAAMTHDE